MLYDVSGADDSERIVFTRNEALRGACVFTSQLDMVIIYFALLQFIEDKQIGVPYLVLMVSSFLLINQVTIFFVTEEFDVEGKLKSMLTFALFGYGFTPMIRTLTTSICTDTIYAVSWIAFVLSMVFQDYGLKGPLVSHVLSLNLGISGAVFLVSRMGDNFDAFWLLTTAICFFVYWPQIRNKINNISFAFPFFYELICFSIACYSVSKLSESYLHMLLISHTFLLLVFPMMLMFLQPMKNTIHGPWDIMAS
ncbi:unnamed protein product [Bursaphelenchus okinawaensis]|uniref:Phosphatidylinositol N-acetylglucosaminyltransferase subunit C n=1 Tax=Bursaphelenchus okinawaensis TaxID=465554 RepID=A0A811LQ90_9BILA|nr:unnamed protein product [Bursaphelenchus okinawaensis]CAG9126100.1 unnamed protein product [Bursaphelenchus okinawaensis]